MADAVKDAPRDTATDADIAVGITAARAATQPPIDEWRARDRFERELLRQVRCVDWRAGREKIGVIKWNGVMVTVLFTEQAS